MRFGDGATEVLNLRVSPPFTAALKTFAEKEKRSMVNMSGVLVVEKLVLLSMDPAAKPTSSRPVAEQARGRA